MIRESSTFTGDVANTFTNAPPSPSLDFDKLMPIWGKLQGSFLKIFKGVPVRVDNELEGNDYYCAVSQGTFEALQRLND